MMRFLWSVNTISCTKQGPCCIQWKPRGSKNGGMFAGRATSYSFAGCSLSKAPTEGGIGAETQPESYFVKPVLYCGAVFSKTRDCLNRCCMGSKWVTLEAAYDSHVWGGGELEALQVPIPGSGEAKRGTQGPLQRSGVADWMCMC